ncbi:hypothetical protein [Qingshengfaniella alkalisoli]|uniref:EthD domain-containing protein n=1 Tax=Qingshengfaniella alkalisoli TaxID=2599296 RepID=A0A5B8J4G3_9RHOB|nr:hypothetical protein [Qingshengfaniella alkalisoli]QDY71598.1 hypothetical protein FPZ52_18165 [Qingshengfaniella alkalisoli]
MDDGAGLILFHRRRPSLSRSAFLDDWARRRASQVNGPGLGLTRYAQLHQVSRLHPIYLAGRVSRSWPVMCLLALLNRRTLPSPRPCRAGWDIVELFEWSRIADMRKALQSDAFQRFQTDGADGIRRATVSSMAWVCSRNAVTSATEVARAASVYAIHPRKSLDITEMRDYWLSAHGPFVAGLQSKIGFSSYDQFLPDVTPMRMPHPVFSQTPAGIAWLGYPTFGQICKGLVSPRSFLANLRLVIDEARFIDAGRADLAVGHVRFAQSWPDEALRNPAPKI